MWWSPLPSPRNPKLPMHLLLKEIAMTTNTPNHYLPCMKSHMSNLLPHQQISNPLTPQTNVNMPFHKPHNVKPCQFSAFCL